MIVVKVGDTAMMLPHMMLNRIFAVGLQLLTFIKLKIFLAIFSLLKIIRKRCADFFFFRIYGYTHLFIFFSNLTMLRDTPPDFLMFNHVNVPRINLI